MKNDCYEVIAKKIDAMSKSQRKIAEYMLNHLMESAFLNVKELAQKTGVSDASIIRFANFLGYDGYKELQKQIQESTKGRWNSSLTKAEDSPAKIIESIYLEELNHVKKTLQSLDSEKFLQIADLLVKAPRVFLVCGRSSRSLGSYFAHNLKMLLKNVFLIDSFDGNEELFSQLTKEDLVIGITFKRYSKTTVELVEYASKKESFIVAITDYMTSPIVKYAKNYLLVESRQTEYLNSFVAPEVLMDALVTYIGKYKDTAARERIHEYHEVCDALHLYLN